MRVLDAYGAVRFIPGLGRCQKVGLLRLRAAHQRPPTIRCQTHGVTEEAESGQIRTRECAQGRAGCVDRDRLTGGVRLPALMIALNICTLLNRP
jgi:hypothetical protein